MNQIKIFPHALMRIGGIELKHLEKLNIGSDTLIYMLKTLEELKDGKLKIKDTIDEKKRKKILREDSPRNIIENFDEYYQIDCLTDFKNHFYKDVAICKSALSSMKEIEVFKKGALLSSLVFFDEIDKYEPAQSTNKKNRKLETSLLKYLTRIATKTTPFSTFTNLSIIQVSDSKVNRLTFAGQSENLLNVKLNSNIFSIIKKLLMTDETIINSLQIRLNPSISQVKNKYFFFINYNDREFFQEVEKTQLIQEVINFLGKKELARMSDVRDYFRNRVDKKQWTKFENQLFTLLNIGLLEAIIPVENNDPNWIEKLIAFFFERNLTAISNIQQLVDSLLSIQKLLLSFANENSKNRKQKLFEIQKNVSQTFIAINPKIADDEQAQIEYKLDLPNLIYEDSFVQNKSKLSQKEILGVTKSIDEFYSVWKLLFEKYDKNLNVLSDFLNDTFKGQEVPLLVFFEEYCKSFEDFRKKRNYQSINWDDVKNDLLKFYTFSQEGSIDNLDLSVNINPIQHKGTGRTKEGGHYSGGFFVQLFSEGLNDQSRDYYYIEHCHSGYGKMFSRFLDPHYKKVEKDFIQFNSGLSDEETLFLENTDATYFNANLHSNLFSSRLRLPGLYEGTKEFLSLNEIVVKFDAKTNNPILFSTKLQKKLCFIDIGFQATVGRSPLFKLLHSFRYDSFYTPHVFLDRFYGSIKVTKPANISNLYADECCAYYSPRVILDKNIVIRRRKWTIPKSSIPKTSEKNDFHLSFLFINQWRLSLNIPDEVFYTISSREAIQKDISEESQKLSRDDYKPQYLNFLSPDLVLLFQKQIKKAPGSFLLEEMLPSSKNIRVDKGEKYVSEFSIQYYSK